MPRPIGPMTERQRRLENCRRIAKDIELPLRKYFADLLAIPPHKITPAMFADIQGSADDLSEAVRRCAQSLYDLIDVIDAESVARGEPVMSVVEEAAARLRALEESPRIPQERR